MLRRLYGRLIAVWGCIFFAFLLLYWVRILSAIVLGTVIGVYCKCRRVRLAGIVAWIQGLTAGRENILAIWLLGLGLFVRLAWLAFLSVRGLSTDISDYKLLWQNAQDMADGVMPICKSWMTAGFYAFCIKFFGNHITAAYVWTMLLQIVTAWVGYVFCRRTLGALPAMSFLLVAILSPNIFVLSTVTATENLFALFLVVSLILLRIVVERRSIKLAACLGCVLWFATWSRCEGLILWIAVFAVLISLAVFRQINLAFAIKSLIVLVLAFALGTVVALRINEACSGDKTIFCSNDNLIPRYMGSVSRNSGRFSAEIYRDFDSIHGSGSVAQAHQGEREIREEWFLYLKKRTAENWESMGWWERVRHIFNKEIIDWWGYGTMGLATTSLAYEFVFAPFAVVVFGLSLLYFAMMLKRGCAGLDYGYLGLVLFGTVSALALSEAQPRYGYLVYWASAFYVAYLMKALFVVPGADICKSICEDASVRVCN